MRVIRERGPSRVARRSSRVAARGENVMSMMRRRGLSSPTPSARSLAMNGDERSAASSTVVGREALFVRLNDRVDRALAEGTLTNDEIMSMIKLVAAFGLEDAGVVDEEAVRYVLGAEDSGGGGNDPSLVAATTSVSPFAANDGNAPSNVEESSAREESGANATATHAHARNRTSSFSRRGSGRLSMSAFTDDQDAAKKKPVVRRRRDGETVEDRLLRDWILKRAREAAKQEQLRQAEIEATNSVRKSKIEIDRATEELHRRAAQSEEHLESLRKQAELDAKRMASVSISKAMGKKTRELTSKMPDFSSRMQAFVARATERAERRKEEAEAERRAREAVDYTRDKYPLTKKASMTSRTIDDLEAWNSRRAEKIELAKAKRAEEELAGATFKPALDPKSLLLAVKRRTKGASDAKKRASAHISATPFTPRIDRRSTRIAATLPDSQETVYQRLYNRSSATPSRTEHKSDERWGGYGVDDSFGDDEEKENDSADAPGFISLADVDDT